MRTMKTTAILMALLPALALAPAALPAATAAQGITATAVSVKILGDSTMHRWEASAGAATITASVLPAAQGLSAAIDKQGLQSLDLVVGVDSLASPEGSGMNKNMHKAMESDKYPDIRFSLRSYALQGATVTAQGDLSIHGQSKSVSLTGQLSDAKGGVELKGSYPLLMSDYGVKPPVMMLGTIRVADKVTIVYDFTLAQ
jgi:polyisoprenoid-binding protein YceI